MHIICPSCDTTFLVSKKDFGAKARKVRCSKCFNVWTATLNNDSNETESLNLNRSEKNSDCNNSAQSQPILNMKVQKKSCVELLPIITSNKVIIPRYLVILPIILLFMIAVTLFFTVKYNAFVKYLALRESKDLILQNITTQYDANTQLRVIRYNIFNNSHEKLPLPLIRIRTYNHNSKLINSHIFENKNLILKPKEYIIVKTDFHDADSGLSSFDITLGNRLSFIIE